MHRQSDEYDRRASAETGKIKQTVYTEPPLDTGEVLLYLELKIW